MSTSPVRPEHIPDHVKDTLARGLVKAVNRFYSNPENVRKFEEWKARKAQEAAAV